MYLNIQPKTKIDCDVEKNTYTELQKKMTNNLNYRKKVTIPWFATEINFGARFHLITDHQDLLVVGAFYLIALFIARFNFST